MAMMTPVKKTAPVAAGIKRKLSTPDGTEKRPRSIEATVKTIPLQRPKQPAGQPWPVNDLRAFDAPTEGLIPSSDYNYGPMLREVLKARGWKYSNNPCHGTLDKDTLQSTFHTKEFEASLRGEKPEKVFGKSGAEEEGYRLQTIPLPKHALWMMGRLPYRVPGTNMGRVREREDFINIVCEHGHKLMGKSGNYRICKFPGTETLTYKTNLTEAFHNKPWYPATYILPKEKDALLKEIESKGSSKNNMWIGKPRDGYGGAGIQVWKGSDADLVKTVQESHRHPRSVMQSYLADPHLVAGYKYHMRIHLVITNVCPLEAYVQENGQCLFATKPYTLSNKTLGTSFDPPVHVTNMCLNAKPENKENYFKKKPIIGAGQQIRMKQLMSHLVATDPSFNKQKLWQQVLNIAKETAIYFAQGVVRHGKIARDRHFEIFGMDLMLDKDMKVWMCEVNTDPGLSYPEKEVLGSPNPDYQKELQACKDTFHDLFALLGLDAGREQTQGSLQHWFEVDFSDTKTNNVFKGPREI